MKSFGHVPPLMRLSRTLITPHLMGRPLGAPGDGERQLDVIRTALELLAVDEPTIVDFPGSYRAS